MSFLTCERLCHALTFPGSASIALCVAGHPFVQLFFDNSDKRFANLDKRSARAYDAFPIIRSKQIQNRPKFPIKMDLF